MAADPARIQEGAPAGGALRALSRFTWRRPRLKTLGQISAPVAAFVFVYVAALIPKEGATGWADSYMLSTKAQHPNCAYKWMQYITQPKPQAQQAIYFGETPVNKKACSVMNTLAKGSCAQYSANAPESFYNSIKFWKTPIADCGNGQKNCTDLRAWTTAWQQVKG